MENEKKPQIRVNSTRTCVWAHNYKCGVLASTKAEAISKIKEKFPGDYEIVDVNEQHRERKHQVQAKAETDTTKEMEPVLN